MESGSLALPARPGLGLRALGVLVFMLPVLLCVLGAVPLAKPVFVAATILVAMLLVRRFPGDYVSFVLCLFILAPGLRHFVDWYAGFSLTNPIMLAPYFAVLTALPTVGLYLLNRQPYAGLCAVMFVLVSIGVWMTLLNGLIQEPVLVAVQWLCPVLLAMYIWAHAKVLQSVRASVLRTMRVMLPIVAIYGLVQFVSILPWDAYYMRMAPINSIGWPEPFMVRVFSTMNHSGSLAAFLGTAILLLLPQIRGVEFLSILLAFCTLFVTTTRSAMGALTLTILVLAVVSGSRTVRASLRKLCIIMAIAVAAAMAVPGMAKKLSGSVGSVTRLADDGSAQERLAQYAELASRLEERPFGWGLAWSRNALLNKGNREVPLDSGVIDILVSFGMFGGLLFLAVLGLLLIQGWRLASRLPSTQAKAEFGVVIYGFSQLPFGIQHAGEHGIFLYLGIGLLLARAFAPESRTAVGTAARDVSRQQAAHKPLGPTGWGTPAGNQIGVARP